MNTPAQPMQSVGAVVIGRNEGARLLRVLTGARQLVEHVVYVDSGSTDGSPEKAAAQGVHVVALTSKPFTAAKGRQVGLDKLLTLAPGVTFVQFIDGDCVLDAAWLAKAIRFLEEHPQVASVCGRRREEFPQRTMYNALIDIDWDGKAGAIDYCGGDSFCRVAALTQIGGWATDLIAGEDPDLGFRFRDAGWENHRLAEEMTLHDVNMASFGAYWKRAVRAGYCFLEVGWRHRRGTGKWWLARVRSSALYGFLFPLAWITGVLLAFFLEPWWLGPILALPITLLYARLFLKLFTFARSKKATTPHALAYAVFNILCKVALFQGTLKRLLAIARGRQAALIEYKPATTEPVASEPPPSEPMSASSRASAEAPHASSRSSSSFPQT